MKLSVIQEKNTIIIKKIMVKYNYRGELRATASNKSVCILSAFSVTGWVHDLSKLAKLSTNLGKIKGRD